MLNRRTLFNSAAAVTSYLVAAVGGRKSVAKTHSFDVEKRGTIGRLERLPSLDTESRDHFHNGIRGWRTTNLVPASRERFNSILLANGYDPKKDLPLAKIFELIKDDHIINTEIRIYLDTKRTAHHHYKREFEQNADIYLAELESYDNRGPGTLELNPDMDIPEYTKHEIHQQPGGYVGSPFAGAIYHYGTNAFYLARNMENHQDESHTRLGQQMATPPDGRITRILDMGCGVSQLTIALKERFPNAEVWGVEVGAPMIRYGHMRAVDLNVDVNLAQRLAEDTKFPDNHFDIVTSYLLHHEVTKTASKEIIAEAYRVLRPGGVYFPIDFYTGGGSGSQNSFDTSAFGSLMQWVDHRWNNEVWRMEYTDLDFPGEMRIAGFDVDEDGPPAWRRRHNVIGIKPT